MGPRGPVTAKKPTGTYVYDHIPQLRELLPEYRGIPGIYYLQVWVEGQDIAEEAGWVEVANSVTYKIKGPKGICKCRLYCTGTRIPGANFQTSKRTCEIDKNIMEITGLSNGPTVTTSTLKDKPDAEIKKS